MFSSAVRYVPHGVSPPAQFPKRAECTHPCRIGFGSHQRCAARRAADIDRRVRSDAPVESRVLHEPPATARRARSRRPTRLAPPCATAHDLRMLSPHTRGSGALAAAPRNPGWPRKHQRVVRVLVVHAQHAVIAATVRAERNGWRRSSVRTGCAAARRRPGSSSTPSSSFGRVEIGHRLNRLSPQRATDVVRVAWRQHDGVGFAALDGFEAQTGACVGFSCTGSEQRRCGSKRRKCNAGAQHLSPSQAMGEKFVETGSRRKRSVGHRLQYHIEGSTERN